MKAVPEPTEQIEPEVARARQPKWLAYMLLAYFGFEPPAALSTGAFIAVLARLGVSAHAVRSTLTRLAGSGVMLRYKQGRETYYAFPPQVASTLLRGNSLAWRDADPTWDGTWTVLAYSISEDRRDLRHRVRSRLARSGFGLLRSGVWVAPRAVDVSTLFQNLDVLDEIRVFLSTPYGGATSADLIKEAYDLDEIANRYHRFIERWGGKRKIEELDDLSAFLLIRSEWQQIVQMDPRLPEEYLPKGWPATKADQLFRSCYLRWEKPATRIAEGIFGRLLISELADGG